MKAEEIYSDVFRMLRNRLERGSMVPFYKIGPKLRAWMLRYSVREVGSVEWHARYCEKSVPAPEGYMGVVYEAEWKKVCRKPRSKYGHSVLQTLRPNPFYLEIPFELVERGLVLGYLP
jgi:hypothetical protein